MVFGTHASSGLTALLAFSILLNKKEPAPKPGAYCFNSSWNVSQVLSNSSACNPHSTGSP
jgi:hypothetical protein